ncbi:LamG-like jellyroll fold domain-containing protein [Kribbella qitaiheensis]|uniref:LamG-like jellyroll fold domain-containing protein n=1 Tax=Kribbella qitaiheensis TaxID=1544730 RepID=UPI00361CF4A1
MALLYAYSFDEASGNILDASGNGRDTVFGGSLSRSASGHTSKGITQTSPAADSAGPSITGLQTANCTLMGWVFRTDNSVIGWFGEIKSGGSGNRGILLGLSGNVGFRCRNSGGTPQTPSVAQPAINGWWHVAGTWDGANVKLFINGTQVASTALTGTPHTSGTGSHLMDTLGAETILDDVRYYDTALDAATITTLMGTPVSSGASFSGNVALSGSGTLTNAGTPAVTGSRALSGNGTLANAGSPAVSGSRSLSGAGTLAAAGSPAVARTAALTGSGTLTGIATVTTAGSAALSGAGSLTATGTPGHTGTAGLSGAGSLTAAGQPMLPGNLSLSGGGLLLLSHGDNYAGAINLAGAGALASSGTPATLGTLSLVGSGSLAATGAPAHRGVAQFSGNGTLAKAGSHGPAVQPVLTATNTPSSGLTPNPKPHLVPSNAPSSQLEVSHGV